MRKKSNVGTTAATPAIVVFGLDEADKPHAAYFSEADSELATKAAALMGFNVVKVANAEQATIASSLPAGQIYANGRGLVPYVRQDLYAKVTELAASQPTEEPTRGEKPSGRPADLRLPRHWDDIDVGHLVIAPEDDRKADGWWQAIVAEKHGDIFMVRWQAYPRQRKIPRHRFNLALMYPGDAVAQATAESSGASSSPQYPKTWADIAIDSLVLAKGEGPVEAWWDAIVIEQNGDTFTLRWRDYPKLPAIVRHRLNLSLLYPNPH
jgi:hypothetical protein